MDFSLTDDQRLIRDTVRQFMDAEVRPMIRARDREEKFASAELRKLGELGCSGMLVPESWGGAGAELQHRLFSPAKSKFVAVGFTGCGKTLKFCGSCL